jgi:glycosyltransferase involved in cell wall biosynthesis
MANMTPIAIASMDLLKPLTCDSRAPLQATAVIVLYGLAPDESPAFRSLVEARKKLPTGGAAVPIVLWDNSPSQQLPAHLPENVWYHHDPRNPGLAAAYNQILALAASQHSQWLITLDQDSTVPSDYLLRMISAAHLSVFQPDIGAIAPQIAVDRKQLSPYCFALGAIPRWYRPGFCGIPNDSVFAFNSGAMLRVTALRQIGGYDLRFPLEYSDTAMFHKLHQHGKRVYINGEIHLRHEFSLIELNRLLSEERYRRTLLAESAFWDLHMNWLAGCERTARLFLRMIRQWVRGDRSELRRVTRDFLFLRLFRSRRTRLRRWRESLEQNYLPDPVFAGETKPRSKVSVCMAAYNGAKFIEAQLDSILPQLAPDDEIVIIDDGSQDDTIERIKKMRDSRIRLYAHGKNEGLVATFEEALRCATGEILFLCDDDDLWAPTKVERVLREFEQHPEAQVVASRVALIDERGAHLPDARVNRYGNFLPGFWRNIVTNHYQGSAMAIRASFLGRVLPFPHSKLFLHDVWIGTRNEALGGKTAFIREPLVYYRRHPQNASQRHDLLRLLMVRIDLLMAHILHAL